MDDDERLLRRAYEAFNARDVEAVIAGLRPDVDWPNAWEGGRLQGHDAVRDYWTRQFAEIAPDVRPLGFARRDDGRVAVRVQQTVRSLSGEVLADEEVVHVYALADGRIARMDVEHAAG